MSELVAERLSKDGFKEFGEMSEGSNVASDILINQGRRGKFHDLAKLDFAGGQVGINLFDSQAMSAPFVVELVERHPLGSKIFIPVDGVAYLVVVAKDNTGAPCRDRTFAALPDQSVNIHRNVRHKALTPIKNSEKCVDIDRVGCGNNLEKLWFKHHLQCDALKSA